MTATVLLDGDGRALDRCRRKSSDPHGALVEDLEDLGTFSVSADGR